MLRRPRDARGQTAGSKARDARSSGVGTRDVGGRGGKVVLETERLVLREMAVSYTHLDVYKRQA